MHLIDDLENPDAMTWCTRTDDQATYDVQCVDCRDCLQAVIRDGEAAARRLADLDRARMHKLQMTRGAS